MVAKSVADLEALNCEVSRRFSSVDTRAATFSPDPTVPVEHSRRMAGALRDLTAY
jgi:hypothetical protein